MSRRQHEMAIAFLLFCCHVPASAGNDWPQLLRDAAHSGDASEQQLSMPLGLVAQVKLADAVLTSPVVVGGNVFVVDQMAAAYCVDPNAGRILWTSAPEGKAAMGSNTSSPCVGQGKVFYGTTAGNLHILDARTGQAIRSIALGQPVLGAITLANDSIYFQTLDAVVHCLDLNGDRRWQWDHYNGLGRRPGPKIKPHYGGVAVSVSGRRVVMAIGYDLVCVEDHGTEAKHVWTQSQPITNVYLPVGTAVRGDYVYCAFPGKDGHGALLRVSLADGSFDKQRDVIKEQWAVLAPPAVRGKTAYYSRQAFGVTAYRFGSDGEFLWRTFGDDPDGFTPSISSPALSRRHCLLTTLYGELVAVDLAARGRGPRQLGAGVFRFQTPHGSPISSSPAITDGRVYFGSDDGCLYVLGDATGGHPKKEPVVVHQRRSRVTPAGRRRYGWPSAFGGPRNANFVDDAGLKPPLRLRWAVRSGGLFKQPVCAADEDVVYVTLGGFVVCREQSTGRMRWRRKLAKQAWCRSALLCADGKVYVPRMFSTRYPKVHGQGNAIYCLDGQTGRVVWENPLGIGDRLRASPVFADGVVAYGSLYQEGQPPTFRPPGQAVGQAVDAWDAVTGRHRWRVVFRSTGKRLNGPAGCVGDGIMFFTGGGESPDATGETVAIHPLTGEIIWRTSAAFASQTGTPSFQDGKVYLPGTYKRPLACLSATDGHIVWQQSEGRRHWYVDTVSLGPDYFAVNNKYQGGAKRWNLADGTLAGTPAKRIQLWGPAHGCGSLVLTSESMALSATLGGLFITDARNGKTLWNSPGFASFTCPHAIAANGRIFYCPQTNNMMYCWEPATGQ